MSEIDIDLDDLETVELWAAVGDLVDCSRGSGCLLVA
jgi:hypothetical protein